MQKKTILRLIKVIIALEIIGGVSCFAGGLALHDLKDKIIKEGVLTYNQFARLGIYIWFSCILSFILAYGLYNLRKWSVKLILLFAIFGLLNEIVRVFPNISTSFTPYLPAVIIPYAENIKKILLISVDILIIYFFTRSRVREVFI
jgi:hypothetical protein